mgnify:CR=1 FL=1
MNKEEVKKIDLGCGPWKKKGFYGIDLREEWLIPNEQALKNDADLYHDLNKGIPFPDNQIEEIYCSHFLEHINNPYMLLDECYRVCKNKAIIEIKVPLLSIFPPDHITMFYDGWFERNIRLEGAYFENRFKIVDSKTILKEFEDYSKVKNSVWEQTIKLEVIK